MTEISEEQAYWDGLHQRWLAQVHKHDCDPAYALGLWMDAVAELQGQSVGGIAPIDGIRYAQHIIGIWSSIFDVILGRAE